METSYRALLAHGSARRLTAALGAAWLSFGMVGLAIFLTARRASGSSAVAGLAVAAFAVGSGALAPFRGRLLDRRGARRWLPVLAAGYAGGLLAFTTLASGGAPTWTYVACSAVAGASAPPLIATLRALWSRIVEPALVRRAYTLTAIVGDVAGVAAPAIGGLLFVVGSWLPLVVCAVSALVAALAVARAAMPPVVPEAGARAPLARALRLLLVVELALGAALGVVEVAVPAAATRWHVTAYSGFLLGAFALGSVAGGIWFGRREWHATAERRYIVATLLLAAALAPPAFATGPAMLAPLLVVAGLAYGPATISLFEALDALAPSRATEALTWITTAGAVGGAAGSAAAGWATERLGIGVPFAAAAVLLAATATTAIRARPAGA